MIGRGNHSNHRKLPPGVAAQRAIFRNYRGSAGRRGLAWEVTEKEFVAILSLPCCYCNCPPSREQTPPLNLHGKPCGTGVFVCNGIDRIDSSIGYVAGNMQPCCETCNAMKSRRTPEDFVAHVKRIAAFQASRKTSA